MEERKKERTNMEEKKDIIKVENTEVLTSNTDLLNLADKISQEVVRKRRSMAININATIVETYWNVGRYIVEFEQKGNTKAKYGASLLTNLSKILRAKVGRGYSRPNLNNMRKFYLMYPICQTSEKSLVPPICQTLSDKLTWSHICELIPNPLYKN